MSVSAEEVAKHNTDKDCWVIVGDQVLDVTNFLSHSDTAETSSSKFTALKVSTVFRFVPFVD